MLERRRALKLKAKLQELKSEEKQKVCMCALVGSAFAWNDA
jgi:hypothetical protein